jgi:hypothetical protein
MLFAALKRPVTLLLLLVLCLSIPQSAQANVGYVSDGKAAGVIIAVVVVGVLIGAGVYFAVHHAHTLRGCVTSGPDGVRLVHEGDGQLYRLIGAVQGIKAGERVRLAGRKVESASPTRQFAVARVTRDEGPCPVQP